MSENHNHGEEGARWRRENDPGEKLPLAAGSRFFYYPRTLQLSKIREIFEAYVGGTLSTEEEDMVQWCADHNENVHNALSAFLESYEESLAEWEGEVDIELDSCDLGGRPVEDDGIDEEGGDDGLDEDLNDGPPEAPGQRPEKNRETEIQSDSGSASAPHARETRRAARENKGGGERSEDHFGNGTTVMDA